MPTRIKNGAALARMDNAALDGKGHGGPFTKHQQAEVERVRAEIAPAKTAIVDALNTMTDRP